MRPHLLIFGTFPKQNTSWGLNIQTCESVRTISHSNYSKQFLFTGPLWKVSSGGACLGKDFPSSSCWPWKESLIPTKLGMFKDGFWAFFLPAGSNTPNWGSSSFPVSCPAQSTPHLAFSDETVHGMHTEACRLLQFIPAKYSTSKLCSLRTTGFIKECITVAEHAHSLCLAFEYFYTLTLFAQRNRRDLCMKPKIN